MGNTTKRKEGMSVVTRIEVGSTLVPMECGKCGVWFALTEHMIAERRKDGETFWCPNGHGRVYRHSELDQLRQQVQAAEELASWARRDTQRLQREKDQLANDLLDQVKLHKRVLRRVHGGVCPHCSRTFQNLQEHVARQHPAADGVVPQPTRKRAS